MIPLAYRQISLLQSDVTPPAVPRHKPVIFSAITRSVLISSTAFADSFLPLAWTQLLCKMLTSVTP
jgi:hypothetical protein